MSINSRERSALQSKKFIAYLVAEATWKLIIGYAIYQQGLAVNVWLFVLVVTTGFLEVGYILGQAYIDKFVRVAEIAKGTKENEPG
jgi:hypothetical protein